MNGLDFFVEAVPPSLAVQYGRKVEEAGFRTAWFPEIVFGDAFAPATATATGTSTLLLGTGVVGIWSRSPVTMALQAASVNELSGGRMLLGLGVQARNYVSDWHGRTYERPIRAVREYLTILRQALAGEEVTFEGEIFSVRGFQLQMPMPEKPVRLYLAAVGPQMIRLAGELADGVLGYCWSIPYVEQVVLPALREGVARAGRTLADIDVAVAEHAVGELARERIVSRQPPPGTATPAVVGICSWKTRRTEKISPSKVTASPASAWRRIVRYSRTARIGRS